MKYCEKCKTVSQFDVFCTQCGEKLSDLPRCECGNEIKPDDKFCGACGKDKTELLYVKKHMAIEILIKQNRSWWKFFSPFFGERN